MSMGVGLLVCSRIDRMHGSPLCCQRHCAHSRLSQGFGPCLPRPSSGPDSLSPVEDRLLPANPPASCGLSSVKDPRLPQRSSQKSQPCPYKSVPHASHLTTILLKSIRGAHFHLPIPSHPPCAHSPKVSAELPSSHPQGLLALRELPISLWKNPSEGRVYLYPLCLTPK